MATTKIWAVKNRLDHVLEYVGDEDKTIDKLGSYVSRNGATANQKYMTCVNCSSIDPFTSMMNLKESFHDDSKIVAYHAVQSFKPGEGNADLIHEIGVKTVSKLFGDQYQFVVCTHLDKEHLHNHIVINPISIVDGKRYHNSMKDIYKLREVSDEICRQYGLSIIEEPIGKGQSRNEYYQARSYIREIKKDIDDAILRNYDVDSFIKDMNLEGYEFVKIEDMPCILHPNYSKAIPLTLLGQKYSLDSIDQRIEKSEPTFVRLKITYKQKDANSLYQLYKEHKLNGFLKDVVKFQILIGILPNYVGTKVRLSKEMRMECRKLDLITRATTIVAKNHIETLDELDIKIIDLKNQLNELSITRKQLYSKSYKENDLIEKAKFSEEAKQLTPMIKELRQEIKSLEYMKDHSRRCIDYNKELERKREIER